MLGSPGSRFMPPILTSCKKKAQILGIPGPLKSSCGCWLMQVILILLILVILLIFLSYEITHAWWNASSDMNPRWRRSIHRAFVGRNRVPVGFIRELSRPLPAQVYSLTAVLQVAIQLFILFADQFPNIPKQTPWYVPAKFGKRWFLRYDVGVTRVTWTIWYPSHPSHLPLSATNVGCHRWRWKMPGATAGLPNWLSDTFGGSLFGDELRLQKCRRDRWKSTCRYTKRIIYDRWLLIFKHRFGRHVETYKIYPPSCCSCLASPAFQLETHMPLDQMMSHHPRTVLMIWPSCIQEHSGTILKKAHVSTTHSPKLPGLPFIELGAYGTDVASAKDGHSISEFSAQIHQNPHVMPCCERNRLLDTFSIVSRCFHLPSGDVWSMFPLLR